MKLFDSERKVMEVLWREGGISAGQVVKILKEETGFYLQAFNFQAGGTGL